MEWIIALLIWLSADDSEAAVERHRAAACAGLAYGAMHRPVALDDAGEEKLVEPGGEAVDPPFVPTVNPEVRSLMSTSPSNREVFLPVSVRVTTAAVPV